MIKKGNRALDINKASISYLLTGLSRCGECGYMHQCNKRCYFYKNV